MKNRYPCKVIEQKDEDFIVLLENGKRAKLQASFVSEPIEVGDELAVYLDDAGQIAYVEKCEKPQVPPATPSTPVEKEQKIYVTHATAQGYDEGSFFGGFLLTFFFPVVGLIIALAFNKPETRRGALRAVVVQLILGAAVFLLGMCGLCSLSGY